MDEIRSQHAEPITSKRAALNRGNGRFDLHAQNAGADGAIVVAAIRRRQQDSGNLMIGFDAMRGEYGDLVAWGIIDPAKVARAALENAVSVAGMILSTDVLIAELPEPKPNGAAAAPELEYWAAILIAPLINGLFTFGEEFGWRAYLLPKLLPLGERRALLLTGLIWGVWHWPVIAMGHNYGLTYPGAPWTGMFAMVWFTLVTGTFLGWAALRGGSVWPAVIGHAAINGISALGLLFVQGQPNPLLGPLPVGLIGSTAWAALALVILLRRGPLIVARPTAHLLHHHGQ